jgi:glycosidase
MEGIPFVYYGTEQGFDGHERQPLWYSRFSHDNPLWLFLRIAIAYRKQAEIWNAGIAEQHHVDNKTLVLSRGPFVIALNAHGEPGPTSTEVQAVLDMPERFRGQVLTNIFDPQVTEQDSASGGGGGGGPLHSQQQLELAA